MRFYIVGTCPICASAGNSVALVNKADHTTFFYCTSCGVAWRKVPSVGDEINEYLSIQEIAPLGVYAPTAEFLESNGFVISESTEYESIFEVIEQ